jgi:hypothetical protein
MLCLLADPDPSGASAHAEPDAFYCFVDLMASFRDNFCQQLVRATLACAHVQLRYTSPCTPRSVPQQCHTTECHPSRPGPHALIQDNSAVGIRATLGQLSVLLRRLDEDLWEHLERVAGVNPQYYAFRWITLLLTQVEAAGEGVKYCPGLGYYSEVDRCCTSDWLLLPRCK